MKFLNRSPALLVLGLTLGLGLNADAADLSCEDAASSPSVIEKRETLRREISAYASQRESLKNAQSLVRFTLEDALREMVPADELTKITQGVNLLIENPIFEEALTRSLFLSGVKSVKEIDDFKSKLAIASEAHQIEFGKLVLRQYDVLIERAFTFVDEDKINDLAKRWNLTTDDAFHILKQWNLLGESRKPEIILASLAWAKVIDPKRVSEEMGKIRGVLRKKNEKLPLHDAEKTLVTQIMSPHTDFDLASNKGPISDDEFKRRVMVWNVLGLSKHFVNRVLYSKASFAILASLAPVGITHALLKDWNVTNTLATVVGGVATCAPIVDNIAVMEIGVQHDAIWLDVLTLRQLSEFKNWTTAYPKRARELGFQGLNAAIEHRIHYLRALRYNGEL